MGIIRSIESKKNKKQDVEEFRRLLLKRAFVFERRRKSELQACNDAPHPDRVKEITTEEEENGEEEKLVCVTSGVTFLGLAIVNRLLSRGYSVRIAVDNEEDMEKLREMEMFREETNVGVSAVMVKVTDIESLSQAFSGCRGVFHTSAFVDPAGVSGYTKYMAELEVKASENVMEACARTESVRKCVFTSSLLACVWRDNALHDLPPVIDHNCWSEESICRDKKLWFALGKTMAERAAWRMAEDSEVKLATICPGLLTGPDSFPRNSMSSFAYLKGAQEMYADGLLATADVSKVADAHLCVYEALTNTACGRYICFNRVIQTEEEAVELAREMGMPFQRISRNRLHDEHDSPAQFKLCNQKLVKLMSRQSRCSKTL